MDSTVCRKGLEKLTARALGFAFAGPAQQRDALVGQVGLEVAAVVVLVADQDLPWPGVGEGAVGVQQIEQDLAFVGFRAGQGEADRQAVQGRHQVQPKSPEVAGRAAQQPYSAHPASSGRRTVSRDRAHSTGVASTTHIIGPHADVPAEHPDQPVQRPGQLPEPLVVARLLRQTREPVA